MSKLYIIFKSWWIGDKVSAEGFYFNWNGLITVILVVVVIFNILCRLKMILAKLKWNTPLYKVDEFITKFRDKYKNKQVRIDVKLTDTECLIYLFKKFN